MERSESSVPARVELGVGGGGYCKELVSREGGPVWAYDTFDGIFPEHTAIDGEDRKVLKRIGAPCHPGVKDELEAIGVTCIKGEFPATYLVSSPEKVSFVRVDMDTYISTESALRLFHEHMVEGGVFLIHDYDNWGLPGVKRAADEFMSGPLGVWYDADHHEGHYRLRKRPSAKT